MSLEIKYKGYEINFSEWDDAWSCEGISTGQSVEAIKVAIDSHIKKESAFPRQKALIKGERSYRERKLNLIEVEVTSASDPGYFWVVNEHGKRRKESAKRLFIDCPENRELGERLDAMDAKIEAMREEIETMWGEARPFEPSK